MIKETTHHELRSPEGRIGPIVTLNSAEGGNATSQGTECPAGSGPADSGGPDGPGQATKSNPVRPEPCTRDALAEAVKDKFGVDISPLWKCMQREDRLPRNLPSTWDPVWGKDGAWEHLQGRRSIRQSERANHGAARFSLVRVELRPPCRLCGVAIAVLLCYYEAIAPIHARPHVLKMLRLIESQIRRLRAMQKALASNVESYKEAQTEYLKNAFENARERQFKMKVKNRATFEWRDDAIRRINDWCENSGRLAELPIYAELKCDSWFDDMEKALRLLADDVATNLHLPVQEAIWPLRAGRPTKMIARVRTILKNDGFTWDEVARLVRDDLDIGDPNGARDRARSQVRAMRSQAR